MKLFGNSKGGKRTRQKIKWDEDFMNTSTAEEVSEPKNAEPFADIQEPDTPIEEEKELQSEPAKQEREPDNKKGKIKGSILLAASIVIFLITSFAVAAQLIDNAKAGPVPSTAPTAPVETVAPITDPTEATEEDVSLVMEAPESQKEGIYNILMVGIDDEDKYTDTVMILHIDTETSQVSALSLPHNTLIYGDYDVPMIDEVYNASGKGDDGLDALEEKLESMFGFPVDARIVLTRNSMRSLFNKVGPVEFDVPEDISVSLKKGVQQLDAAAADELLQTKSYKDDAVRRERVQLDFLQAFGVQKLSGKTNAEIAELAKQISSLFDMDLTEKNITYLLSEMQKCDFDGMKSYPMPGRTINYYDRQYHQLDETAMLAILNMSFNPYDDDIDEDDIHIRTEKETGVPVSEYSREINQGNGGTGGTGGTGSTGSTDPDPEPTPEPTPEPDPEPTPEPTEEG